MRPASPLLPAAFLILHNPRKKLTTPSRSLCSLPRAPHPPPTCPTRSKPPREPTGQVFHGTHEIAVANREQMLGPALGSALPQLGGFSRPHRHSRSCLAARCCLRGQAALPSASVPRCRTLGPSRQPVPRRRSKARVALEESSPLLQAGLRPPAHPHLPQTRALRRPRQQGDKPVSSGAPPALSCPPGRCRLASPAPQPTHPAAAGTPEDTDPRRPHRTWQTGPRGGGGAATQPERANQIPQLSSRAGFAGQFSPGRGGIRVVGWRVARPLLEVMQWREFPVAAARGGCGSPWTPGKR